MIKDSLLCSEVCISLSIAVKRASKVPETSDHIILAFSVYIKIYRDSNKYSVYAVFLQQGLHLVSITVDKRSKLCTRASNLLLTSSLLAKTALEKKCTMSKSNSFARLDGAIFLTSTPCTIF